MPGDDAASAVGSDAASTASADQGDAGPVVTKDEDQPDLLKNEASVQDAIFGVLFTISKEKLINSWKYGLAVLLLDILQLFVFNLEDGFPWTFPKKNWAFHLFEDFQLQRLALRGGELVYYIFFWLLTAVVVVSAGLCLFVAHNFKTNNFPYIWPIKLLRFTVSIFFEMLYISSLAMFSVAFDCKIIHEDHAHWEAFPEKDCFKMPILLIAVVGAVMLLISAAISFLQSIAATELDPDSRDLLALAHSSASIKFWVLKTTVTILGEIISEYHKLQGILLLLISCALLWVVVRNVPYYSSHINCFQGALYSLLTWQALILFALVWEESWAQIATYMMLIGQPFAFAGGWALVWTRLFYAERIAKRFKDARAAGVLRVRHRFRDAYEVEICARCARKKDPDHEPIMAWVDAADMMYQTGLEQYSESVFLHIAYANFLSTYKKSAMTQMAAHLAIARKCDPGLSERFNLFTKQREHSQASESDQSGEGAKDLVSIVEFQTNLKLALQAHSDTLRDIRGFWRELCSKKTTFSSLSEAFTQMHLSQTRSEEIYKIVTQKYPKSVKILRAYVRFLREIKNDPWKAQKYDLLADNYEQAQIESAKEAQFAAHIGVGGDLSNLLSEDNPDGVVMITDEGKITFVNKKVQSLFGYTKPELEGKNVAMLMPPPFSMQHHAFLRSYKQTQKGNLLGTGPREVIGAHKNGFVFPVKVTIEKSTGTDGYTGVFHEVHEDPKAGIAWTSGEGQLYCVSKGFMTLLGYSFQDLKRSIQAIGANEEFEKEIAAANQKCSMFFDMMKKDKEQALLLPPYEFEVAIKHKYGAIVTCRVSVKFSGAEELRLLSCTFTLAGDNAKMGLLTADVNGRILYANSLLENALHLTIGSLSSGHTVSELIPSPHAGMHTKWIQAATRARTLPMAPSSCRNGKVVVFAGLKGREVPMKLSVTLGDLMGQRVWNAMAEPLPIPIGVSGGGFGPLRIPNQVARTKRLRLMVREDGVILGAAADNAWALNALGVDPSKIIHQPLAQYIDVFADVSRSLPSGRLTPTLVTGEGPIAPNPVGATASLLEMLEKHSFVISGTQHGPTSWSTLWALPAPPGGNPVRLPILMEVPDMIEEEIDVEEACDAGLVDREDLVDEKSCGSCLAVLDCRQVAACLGVCFGSFMHISISLGIPAMVEYRVCAIDIWRTDVLDGVMEVDGTCNIKQANKDACTMFGYPAAGMKTLNLSRLFQLADIVPRGGEHAGKIRVEDFLEMKKTQLKGAKVEAVTDSKKVNANHADGSPLMCSVQGMDKHGDGLRFQLRITASVATWTTSSNLDRIKAKALSEKPAEGIVHHVTRRPGAQDIDEDQIKPEEEAEDTGKADAGEEEEEEEVKNVKADQASVADSATSGNKAMDDKRHEEFTRAKQFRKLSKLLNTPAAKRPIIQFRNFAIAVLAVLVIIQVVTCILDRTLIRRLDKLSVTGFDTVSALTFTVQINYCATVLWASLDSYAPPAWNSYNPYVIKEIASQIASQMNDRTARLDAILKEAFLNPVNNQVAQFFFPGTDSDYYESRYIDVYPTPFYISERASLEKTQAILVRSAYQVAQLPAAYKNNLSFWEPYRFIDDNALPVILPAVQSFADLVFDFLKSAFNTTTELVLVLLVVYAIAIMAALTFVMMFLVRRAASSRLQLFSIFTALPRPTVLALASQSISVTGGGHEDEEEEAWQQTAAAEMGGNQGNVGKEPQAVQDALDSDVPQGLNSKKVNYNLSNKRQLTGMGYGMYTLVLPFFAWMIVLVAVYSNNYIQVSNSIKPCTAAIYGNQLNMYNLKVDLAAQRLVLSTTNSSISAQRTALTTAAQTMVTIARYIVTGNETLQIPSGLLEDPFARHILLDPVCLRQDSANCLTSASPYYSDLNQGLQAAINNYASAALALAAQPASALSINNSYVLFIASQGATEIYEGIDTLANYMLAQFAAINSRVETIEIIVMIVLLVMVPLYYWYMLQPFYKRLGKESRRVAELLSQLPKSIDVQGLVAEAMAVQVPSNKSGPVTTIKPKKRSWHVPFFGRKGPAYQSLKDVDSPAKNKGSRASAVSETADDVPLLKVGSPTKAQYHEKLSRRAASDDDEPFVPRPNTRIKFQLPDTTVTPSQPETEAALVSDSGTASNATAAVALASDDDLISATLLNPSPAAYVAGGVNATVPASDLVPSNMPTSENTDQTLI